MKDLFIFEESDEPMLYDDQYVLRSNKDITIQCCEDGMYSVNKWFPEVEGMSCDEVDNLNDAFKLALSL